MDQSEKPVLSGLGESIPSHVRHAGLIAWVNSVVALTRPALPRVTGVMCILPH